MEVGGFFSKSCEEVRGVLIAGSGVIINGLCVWGMFSVIYISSCIQYYYSSHVKVINYLHSNRREASVLYFSHNPKMGSR